LRAVSIFVILSIVLVIVFLLYPLIQVIGLSFTSWSGFRPPFFVGLTNFNALFQDPVLYQALTNNVIWALGFLVINNALGLFLAGSIDILGKRLGSFFRTLLYVSVLLPNVVVSFLFVAIYDPNIGLLDGFLNSIGLTPLSSTQWLSDPHIAIFSVLASSIWQYAAFPMLIFIAAFSAISPSIYEAAALDGANQWQIFWKIKVPIIRPVIFTILALTWIWNSMPFSQIYTMTKGGPGHATDVLVTYMYSLAFSGLRLGYASAVAVVLFIVIIPAAIIFLKLFEK
jgi:ABC-type sugar transport system permease subunit